MIVLLLLGVLSLPFLFILYKYVQHLHLCWKFRNVPGETQFLPGQIAQLLPKWLYKAHLTDADQFLNDFANAKHKQYGPVYKFIVWTLPFVLCNDSDLGKQIITKGEKTFQKVQASFSVANHFFSKDLFTADRNEWPRFHNIMAPFFNDQHMREVVEATKKDVGILMKDIDADPIRNVNNDMGRLTVDVIGAAGFGYDFKAIETKGENDKLLQATNDTLRLSPIVAIFPKFMWHMSIFNKLHGAINFFKDTIATIVSARKSDTEEHRDILSLLQNNESEKPLTQGELVSNARIFLIAGHETTARTLVFALYLLATNPKAFQAAQAHADQLSPEMNFEELMNSDHGNYMRAIMKEALRLYPVAIGIMRSNDIDVTVGKQVIPAGAWIIYHWGGRADLESVWDNPKEFLPERHMEKNYPPSTYSPFGIGNRSCIGRKFSEYEFVTALAMLLQNYNFELADKSYKMETKILLTMQPKQDVKLKFSKRSNK